MKKVVQPSQLSEPASRRLFALSSAMGTKRPFCIESTEPDGYR